MKRRNNIIAAVLLCLSLFLFTACTKDDAKSRMQGVIKTELAPACAGRYSKTVNNTDITADFCDCNCLGVILDKSGSTSSVARHTIAKVPAKTLTDIDELSALYADFIGYYDVKNEYKKWTLEEGSVQKNAYDAFVVKAQGIFDACDFVACKNIEHSSKNGVVIGLSRSFDVTTENADVSYSYSDMLFIASELFGYKDKSKFTEYARTLVSTFGAEKDKTTEELRLSLDGAIYTENGAYVMPYVVKSNLATNFSVCLVMKDGVLSAWIEDIDSAAKTVDLSDVKGTSSFSLYGRCNLFETASGYYEFSFEGEELPAGHYATMEISTSDGLSKTITIMLLPEYAPKSVDNFISYAEKGFYDGTVIHRIVANGCLQGGGYEYKNRFVEKKLPDGMKAIEGEFTNNGHPENIIGHCPGTISMARTNEVNSGTSQFFLCFDYYPSWDGEYAGFGFMIYQEDIDFVKKLGKETATNSGSYPTTRRITIEKVTTFSVDANE